MDALQSDLTRQDQYVYMDLGASFDITSFLTHLASIFHVTMQSNAKRDAPTFIAELLINIPAVAAAFQVILCLNLTKDASTLATRRSIFSLLARLVQMKTMMLITIGTKRYEAHTPYDATHPHCMRIDKLHQKALRQRLLDLGIRRGMDAAWPDWCAWLEEMMLLDTTQRSFFQIFTIATRFYPEYKAMRDDGTLRRRTLLTKIAEPAVGKPSQRVLTDTQKVFLVASYIASRLPPDMDRIVFTNQSNRRTPQITHRTTPMFSDPDRIMAIATALGLWSKSDPRIIHCLVF